MRPPPRRLSEERLQERIGARARRKSRARRRGDRSLWFGLGAFGVIGWSVALPTLLGLALGLWIDARWPGGVSWTLTLLFGGLIVGCASAWYWLSFERRLMEEQEDEEEAGDGA
jgi:ATP synthase protein I